MRHAPSLPEIVRVDTSDINLAISHLISFLQPAGRGFNYLEATKCVQAAYRGLHEMNSLTAASAARKQRFGHQFNIDVVKLAAPVAFGRNTRVFHLPARKLPYGDDRLASYRVPFFFVEDRVFKAYFLQPRKNTNFNLKQYGLLGSVLKRNLLENEFYGEKYDLELIDVSKPIDGKDRTTTQFSLQELPSWTDSEIEAHFKVVNEALRIIEEEHLVPIVRRPLKDSALSLFD